MEGMTPDVLQWLADAGGTWLAIAVLYLQNRELSKKLDDCYSEICEELEATRIASAKKSW